MQALAKQVTTLAAFAPTPVARAVCAGNLQSLSVHAERVAAAVLFADISGFTALTEALAIGNANGSEELTVLLNLYFTHMIVLLESYGGQVVKFSGDAITAVFMGQDGYTEAASAHLPSAPEPSLTTATVRATFAAIAMQRAMTDFQQQPTSIGAARLGLKVGVGAGEVLAAHVGGVFDRWEYVIAGDAMSQAVYAQEQSRRGMVVLSAQAAALVGSPDADGQVSLVWSQDNEVSIGDEHPLLAFPQPYRVLAAPPNWESLPYDDLERARSVLRAYVPAAMTSRLKAGQYDWFAELRRMTVLFMGVGGIDYSHHDALDHLQSFIQTVQETLYSYEGSLNKVVVDDKGTVLVILFGAPPLAHEDDALRALAFAQKMQAAYGQPGGGHNGASGESQPGLPALRLAIGITNATVFAGPVGSLTRREYTVMGAAVNLAARLMQKAGAGGTLCDRATYDEGRRHWRMEPETHTMKGIGEVTIYRLTELRVRPVSDDTTPLVGRERELERLIHYFQDVSHEGGSVISLVGEGGMGKTRLIDEAVRHMRNRGIINYVLRGVADSLSQQTPYLVWRDVLIDYFDLEGLQPGEQYMQLMHERICAVDPELEPRLPLLNDVLGVELPETAATRGLNPRQRRESLSFLVIQLLIARARHGAVLVVLDDMHWADSLSWELALDVARTVALQPVFMLVSYRPLESGSEAAKSGKDYYHAAHQALLQLRQQSVLPLLPLEETAVAQLVASALDCKDSSAIGPELVSWLTERSQGNPLFVEETVKMLREHESLRCNEDGIWQFASQRYMNTIPPTLAGVIQTRLDRLEPGTQLTCKVASVIGRTFAQRVVAGIYPMPDEVALLDQRLERLHQLDITPLESLKPEVRYQFKSALTQEVAYGSLLLKQRQELHQAVAAWYEREHAADLEPYVPLLADHYGYSEQWNRFVEFAGRAGRMAAERYATSEALHYLSRAVHVLHDMPALFPPAERNERLFSLLLTRAEVYEYSGDYTNQEQDLNMLGQLAGSLRNDRYQALLQTRWARYYQTHNNYDAAEEAARSALAIAQRLGDRQLMGESNNRLARNAELRADYYQALWWGFKALGDCRLAQDRAGEARSLDFLGVAYAHLGDYAHADQYYQQALELRRKIEDRRGEADSLSRIGNLRNTLGRPLDALRAHQEALAIRRSIGDPGGEAASLCDIGNTLQKLGDLSAAQTHLYTALSVWYTLGDQSGEARLLVNMSAIATELGDFESAQHHAAEGLEFARQLGNRQIEVCALDSLGNAQRGLGLMQDAYDNHMAAYRLAQELQLPRWEAYAQHHLGEWEWAMGHAAAAAGHWQQAAALRAAIGEQEFARASQTRRAHALAVGGDLATAYALADEVWMVWGINPPPGEDEDELRESYLSLYETWKELGELERAGAALAWAYQAVQDRAVRISDSTLRESFLTRVGINRAIVDAWDSLDETL